MLYHNHSLWFNITFRCGAIVLSVVIGTPRPDNKIEQNAISTPFLCPFINNRLNKRYIINPFPWEIEKHKKNIMHMEGLIWVVFLLIGLIIYFYDKNSKKQRTDEYETLLLDTNFEGELISDEEKKHCVTINKSKKQVLCCIISTDRVEDSKLIDNINITTQVVHLKSPTEYISIFMFVDDINNNIHIIEMSYYKLTYHKIKFEDILSVELITDNITVSSKSTLGTIGRGVVGAAVAGGVGAIIGGTTGSSKAIDKFSTLELKITTKDITNHYNIMVYR